MADIWTTVLNLPHRSAAITLPSKAAIARKLDTISSRSKIKNTAQIGTFKGRIETKAKKAAMTKILSTNGSTIAPKGVIVFVSRAIFPSTQSVLAATI